jgi:hypothetical protein
VAARAHRPSDNDLRFGERLGERTSPRRGRARRAREAHRRGRCELARLVRRVYGGGAGRSEASDVIESDLIIGGSPGAYALGPEAGTLLLAKSIERHALSPGYGQPEVILKSWQP